MVVVKTKYTLEIYKEFFWFCLFRGKYYRYGKGIFPFVTLFLTAVCICSLLFSSDRLLFALTGAMAALCLILYLVSFIRPRSYVKKSPALFLSTTEFAFRDSEISILQTGGVAGSTGAIRYEALTKVYETKKAFYLYISPQQAFLLSKDDFVAGTPQELGALLASRLPPGKFILCR